MTKKSLTPSTTNNEKYKLSAQLKALAKLSRPIPPHLHVIFEPLNSSLTRAFMPGFQLHLLENNRQTDAKQIQKQRADSPFKLLQWACCWGEISVAREILTANPTLTNHVGECGEGSPLGHAAWRGHFDLVRILVEEFHADVNLHDNDCAETPLHKACRLIGNHKIIDYLIRQGAKVCAESQQCVELRTPLRRAIFAISNNRSNHEDPLKMFRVLVSHGAMRGESLDLRIYTKTIREIINDCLDKDQNLQTVLSEMSLTQAEGTDALCNALGSITVTQDVPEIDRLLEAFGNIGLEECVPSRLFYIRI